MSCGEADRVVIVDRAARGEPFRAVVPAERDEIQRLFAERIDDAEQLSLSELEADSTLRLNPLSDHRWSSDGRSFLCRILGPRPDPPSFGYEPGRSIRYRRGGRNTERPPSDCRSPPASG